MLLRKWYHLDAGAGSDFESQCVPIFNILVETDSEQGDGDILLQSDSEQEELLATPPCSAEMLLETDSEKESGESPAKKRRRYTTERTAAHRLQFLNRPVCRFAHQRLYAIGSGALQNMRAGNRAYTMQSGRLAEPHHPSLGVSMVRSSENKKWPSIMSFFWLLWISCAEILPIKFVMPGHSETLVETSLPTDPDFQERYVQSFLGCLERNYDLNPATHSYY